MIDTVLLKNIAVGIRSLRHTGPGEFEDTVERYLDQELRDMSFEERMSVIKGLARIFDDSEPEVRQKQNNSAEDAARFVSLLLGKKVAANDLSFAEISENSVNALNTVFDTLNQIIGVINTTLLGQETELETIRKVIVSQIEGKGRDASLKEYLEQIQHAFLTAHTSFQQAAHTVVSEMLSALNPEGLEHSAKHGLKFGPLRKAELFDSYMDKYNECKRWFESGRFSENMLREFEKICQKTYNV